MSRKVTRLVHAGKYVAEITAGSIPDGGAWGLIFPLTMP
jgi:hypothetical protein